MTRFVYLTDTHLGAEREHGYRQQPRYADRLPELLAHLDTWIRAQAPPVAFVLHGGDMVDAASRDLVRLAATTFRLSVPVYLALGNHDLTTRGALDLWLDEASGFFPGSDPAFTLSGDGWRLHVLPSQWCETDYYWDDVQEPHALPQHLERLESALQAEPDVTHLILSHPDLVAVPVEQTGFDAPYHPPAGSMVETIRDVIARHPQVKGVLGGHNHINTHRTVAQAHVLTASAFTETPFEFKIVEVTGEGFAVETLSLLAAAGFGQDYRWDKTWVQGRARDRGFSERWACSVPD